jgi:hypothetical protein
MEELTQRLLALTRPEVGILWIDDHPGCWNEGFIRNLLHYGVEGQQDAAALCAAQWAYYLSDKHVPPNVHLVCVHTVAIIGTGPTVRRSTLPTST